MAMKTSRFDYAVDLLVDTRFFAYSRAWQQEHLAAVTNAFTHVLIETVKPIFGPLHARRVDDDVALLLSKGLRVGMLCHGSEIRLPSRHIEDHPFSPFVIMNSAERKRLENIARRNRKILDSLQVPVFVSTPALLREVPYATWLPVVIDPDLWENTATTLTTELPVVMHAPSRDVLKRSDLIDGPLEELHNRGDIEYRRIRGVPNSRMPELLAEADIVVDTVGTGNYGVAACEAMAAGRLVISYIPRQVRDVVRSETGHDLPILGSDPDKVAETVLSAIKDRERSQAIASRGPAFVRDVHDGRRSAAVLEPFLRG